MSGILNRLTQWPEHKGHLLTLAVNNMTQGVVMFDMAGRFSSATINISPCMGCLRTS